MTEIRGIAEIVLHVRDRKKALSFYRDLLGLALVSPTNFLGPVFLKAGDGNAGIPQMIVLVDLPSDSPEFVPPSHLHHLALEIHPDDFDGFRERFASNDLEIRTGEHPVIPSRTLYVDDPDGNEVELTCRADS